MVRYNMCKKKKAFGHLRNVKKLLLKSVFEKVKKKSGEVYLIFKKHIVLKLKGVFVSLFLTLKIRRQRPGKNYVTWSHRKALPVSGCPVSRFFPLLCIFLVSKIFGSPWFGLFGPQGLSWMFIHSLTPLLYFSLLLLKNFKQKIENII